MKTIYIEYYSLFREQAGKANESWSTEARSAADLFAELNAAYNFSLPIEKLRVAVDDEFSDWQCPLHEGATVVFLPPVAGG